MSEMNLTVTLSKITIKKLMIVKMKNYIALQLVSTIYLFHYFLIDQYIDLLIIIIIIICLNVLLDSKPLYLIARYFD